jgi:hypothetical protein
MAHLVSQDALLSLFSASLQFRCDCRKNLG